MVVLQGMRLAHRRRRDRPGRGVRAVARDRRLPVRRHGARSARVRRRAAAADRGGAPRRAGCRRGAPARSIRSAGAALRVSARGGCHAAPCGSGRLEVAGYRQVRALRLLVLSCLTTLEGEDSSLAPVSIQPAAGPNPRALSLQPLPVCASYLTNSMTRGKAKCPADGVDDVDLAGVEARRERVGGHLELEHAACRSGASIVVRSTTGVS